MPGRNYSAQDYRYGFNGKENDNEVYGPGNFQDYGERMYDPRLGRFPSPDPLIVKYQLFPWYSPYQFAGNKPIWKIDLDGLEEATPPTNEGQTQLKYPSSEELRKTLGPDAQRKVYDMIESPNFAAENGITFDSKGQQALAQTILGVNLRETPQEGRQTYSGRVVQVAMQLSDQNLISEDNPQGLVPGSWQKFTIPEDYIPKNTSSTLNPGKEPNTLPRVDLGEGKAIVYTIQATIEPTQ